MAVFHEVKLSDAVEQGAAGGALFNNSHVRLRSGHRRTNINWSQFLGRWDIAYGIMAMEATQSALFIHEIRDFYNSKQGSAIGFRYKDWSDFEIGDFDNPTTDNQSIGTGNDSLTTFQPFKRYLDSASNLFDQTINKITTGRVAVLEDNVVQADPGDYSINLNTGLITFVVAPAGGVDVQVALDFEKPVHFMEDNLAITVQNFQSGAIRAIMIEQLRV